MTKSLKPPRLPVLQLWILAICRLAEPIALTSVYPYIPEMIENFNVPPEDVSKWAGIASASFSLSQACTGILWGRASDRFGRKPIILFGMLCLMSSCILFGFSTSLAWAIVTRSLAGASSGTVGTMRTIVAELVPQKELQPRAFSIMPLVWTIGSIFGPGFGGALANPAAKYSLFQVRFFKDFPYALPNLIAGLLFLLSLSIGFLFVEETLEERKHTPDIGRSVGRFLLRLFTRKSQNQHRSEDEQTISLLKAARTSSLSSNNADISHHPHKKASQAPPTYREVLSPQSNINLLTYALLALHSVAYDQLLPIFMHYPAATPRYTHFTFKFTSGFGISSSRIGLLFVAYGIAGMFFQFLVYPPVARKLGVLYCLKVVAIVFPVAYILTPFTALLPTSELRQTGIFIIMLLKCWAVIFAFPCTTILLTNSATSLRILGTLNGVAVTISAIGRALGPALCGWTFSIGLDIGYGILPWFTLAFLAILAAIPVWWIVEMDGFKGDSSHLDSDEQEAEIPLPPDEETASHTLNITSHVEGGAGQGSDEAPLIEGEQCLYKSFNRSSTEASPTNG